MAVTAPALGLPDGVRACLFDVDGVLTKTAAVHAIAWKAVFDAFLHERAKHDGEPFVPSTRAGLRRVRRRKAP